MATPAVNRVRDAWGRTRQTVARWRGRYVPYIPRHIARAELQNDIARFLGLAPATIATWWDEYHRLSARQRYAERMGERRTLCFEEAFILFVLTRLTNPPTVVEIGTQYGRSTRRLIDMREHLGLDTRIVCFDVENAVRFFEPGEAELMLRDVTNDVAESVLRAYPPGLIYLDAHPYALLENVIRAVLADGRWPLAIHDCGPGLCNARMTEPKEDPNVSSHKGVWERHVLASIFGVGDPTSAELDDRETELHRLRIFGTPHGLALIVPRALSFAPPG